MLHDSFSSIGLAWKMIMFPSKSECTETTSHIIINSFFLQKFRLSVMRENDGLQCSVVRICKICKTCFHLEVPHTKTNKKMCWLRLQILVKGSCCIVLFTSYSFPFSVRFDLSNRCLHVWDHLQNHFAWQFNHLMDTRITYMYLTVALLF